jgi:hypothetical protein
MRAALVFRRPSAPAFSWATVHVLGLPSTSWSSAALDWVQCRFGHLPAAALLRPDGTVGGPRSSSCTKFSASTACAVTSLLVSSTVAAPRAHRHRLDPHTWPPWHHGFVARPRRRTSPLPSQVILLRLHKLGSLAFSVDDTVLALAPIQPCRRPAFPHRSTVSRRAFFF